MSPDEAISAGGSTLARRSERARRNQANEATEAVKIDDVDRRMLLALADNGRMSISELSERVNLSSTPCWTRLKRLESSGIIDRYVALLDQRKLGLPDTVLIEITLDRHDEDVLDRVGKMLSEDPEILEAYLTTGDYDYIIKVAVAGTNGYERFLREKLYKMPGIRHSRSSFALRCLKHAHSVQPRNHTPS